MKEERLVQRQAELQLRGEAFLLRRGGGVVAVEVEPALGDRDHAGGRGERFQLRGVLEVLRMVRVDADRAVQVEALGDRRGFPAFLDRSAGDDQGRDTRGARGRDDRLEVVAKARVGKVCADVDHSLPRGRPRPILIFRPLMTSLTVPESGKLMRARSASSSTMLMSFSAQGMPESSARLSIAQFCALPWRSASRSFAGSTPSASPRRRLSSFAEMHAQRMRLFTIF